MCGRFTLTSPAQVIAEIFGVDPPDGFEARYNICPSQAVVAIRQTTDEAQRAMAFLHWGLVPHWMKQPPKDARMINARSETAAEKPAFRDSFKSKRCLIPADGFFEWRKESDGKQPYLIRLKSEEPFAIAGLWAAWRSDDGPRLESCALLTTSPNELMEPIHDRMPVILPRDSWELWLDPTITDAAKLKPLLKPADADVMEAFPVSKHVNSPRNDDAKCLVHEAPLTLFDL
ncbi:MAG: SOS response-associated peptidase [Candidatus Binatia bacterium]|nr:SOS response-associated peptidase [Candidatus Binatia bacterium]